jgi:hypothetical protein
LTKPLTADHVPPKNLFARPPPKEMITVPACLACNQGFQKDDDYLRLALTIADKSKGNIERDAILPIVINGLNRPQAVGFRRALIASSSLRPRFSDAGLYMRHANAIELDGARIDRTVERIVKGLFFKAKGHRLPDDHSVNTVAVRRFRALTEVHPELDLAHRQLVALVSEEPLHQVRDAFAYRWAQSPNGVDYTKWLIYFYGHLEYFCSTFIAEPIVSLSLDQEIAVTRAIDGAVAELPLGAEMPEFYISLNGGEPFRASDRYRSAK